MSNADLLKPNTCFSVCLAAMASWSVSYYPRSICAFERSSVDFSCKFDYPDHYYTLKTTKWFKPEAHQNQDGSQVGISVYNSETADIHRLYKNRTAYANKDKNCSLQLHNVSKSDSGKYFFHIETNYFRGKYTGPGGINLIVAGKWKAIFFNDKLNINKSLSPFQHTHLL